MSSVALGTKPLVLTMVTTGTLKASHRRTKRDSLGHAVVAQGRSLGGHNTHGAAVDGRQMRCRRSCRSLRTAPQRCPRRSEQRQPSRGASTRRVRTLVGCSNSKMAGPARLLAGSRATMWAAFSAASSASGSHDGSHTSLGSSLGSACAGDLVALGGGW